jgi:MFS family permease
MATQYQKRIAADRQVSKFCLYTFLKNLKLFEPFLMIFLLNQGLKLVEIGLLYSAREAAILLTEIPSGVIADLWGRKRELMSCFFFYVLSFFLFYQGHSFSMFLGAMILFGFAEALRSGTHKAMMYSWLEHEGYYSERTYIYARVRSFSMWGGAVAGLVGAGFLLLTGKIRLVFLLTSIPYILDFLLVASYPEYMNQTRGERKLRVLWNSTVHTLKVALAPGSLRRVLVNSSIYEGVFRSVRDYIQPILETILLGYLVYESLEVDQRLYLVLGLSYFTIYFFSAIAASQSFHWKETYGAKVSVNRMFFGLGILCLLTGIFIQYGILALLAFFMLFVMSHARRPLMVSILGGLIDEDSRATIFSVESQIKSLVIVVLAPILGAIADYAGIQVMLIVLGLLVLLLSVLIRIPNRKRKFL